MSRTRKVFNIRLNDSTNTASLRSAGNSFHRRGAPCNDQRKRCPRLLFRSTDRKASIISVCINCFEFTIFLSKFSQICQQDLVNVITFLWNIKMGWNNVKNEIVLAKVTIESENTILHFNLQVCPTMPK